MLTILEPILLVFMGIVVGVIVIAGVVKVGRPDREQTHHAPWMGRRRRVRPLPRPSRALCICIPATRAVRRLPGVNLCRHSEAPCSGAGYDEATLAG